MTVECLSTASRMLCPDVLFEVLDALETRNLLTMRTVSKQFFEVVGSLVRRRFTSICSDPAYDLVFESIPTHDYPGNKRQILEFARFVESLGPAKQSDIAELVIRKDSKAIHHIALDDDETFASHLISLHMRASDNRQAKASRLSPFGPVVSQGPAPIPISPAGGRNWSYQTPRQLSSAESSLSSSPASALSSASTGPRRRFAFTLSLADGLERFFRSWFEEDDPRDGPHARSAFNKRVLWPSGAGSLVSATIDCKKVAPRPDHRTRPSHAANPFFGESKRYEFSYESVRLDVSRLVVSVEEGLAPDSMRGTIMLWMRA